jgi:hypothetical protein
MCCCSPLRGGAQAHPPIADVADQPHASTLSTLLKRTTTTRFVLGRETSASPGPCGSRCSSKSLSRGSWLCEAKHQPRPSDPVRAHDRVDDREQAARTHFARRSSGATVRGCDAAPMQCRKQTCAGSTRDARNATGAVRARSRLDLSASSRVPPCCGGRRDGCFAQKVATTSAANALLVLGESSRCRDA